MAPQVAGQQAIELVGEGLPVGLAERRRSPGVNAARANREGKGARSIFFFRKYENRPGTFLVPFTQGLFSPTENKPGTFHMVPFTGSCDYSHRVLSYSDPEIL